MHKRRKPSREERKKPTSKNKLTYGIVALVLIIVCLFAFFQFYFRNPSSDSQTDRPKAALIDHLSFSSPPRSESEKDQWETFKDQCRTILENAGFSYTYYKGEKVTVDFYRNLPKYKISLMILRVHSAVIKDADGNPTNLIGFFTSEVFNETNKSTYLDDLKNSRLALSSLFTGSNDTYLGITPFFVKEKMEENFKDTVIIMMGCEGLNQTSMADALVRLRKAKVYISWTGPVSISHTDQSTIRLLQNLLEENRTIEDAVQDINPDPTWGWSKLDYYPSEGEEDVGNYRIQDFISDLSTNVAQILPIFDEPRRFRAKLFHRLLGN